MKKTNIRTIPGFTLPEVLITTAIISLVAAISLISLSDVKKRQEVNGAMRQVASAVREAQNYALTGKNISSGTSDQPCLFRVRANGNPDAQTFQLEQMNVGHSQCPGGGSNSADEWASISYRTMNGVSVSASAVGMPVSAGAIRFSVPRGEPTANGVELTGNYRVQFAVSKGGLTAHVCVYPLGRIAEKGVGEGGC